MLEKEETSDSATVFVPRPSCRLPLGTSTLLACIFTCCLQASLWLKLIGLVQKVGGYLAQFLHSLSELRELLQFALNMMTAR